MAEPGESTVPPSVVAFAQRLSARARAALPRWEWEARSGPPPSPEEFSRRLAEHGIPEWPFLWPLEEAFGGIAVRIGWEDLSFGIVRALPYVAREDLLGEDGQVRFVRVGDWGNDQMFVDESGQVYLRAERGPFTAIEPSFASFLEAQAMSAAFADWSPTLFCAHFAPKDAAPALAGALGVPPVDRVCNAFHCWWQDATTTLYASSEDDAPAAVWATTLAGLVAALDAAAGLSPGLRVEPVASHDEAHVEVLGAAGVRERAPDEQALATRPGARRLPLLGKPSIYEGKPLSTGDVWISGQGDSLRVDVLERREGQVVNYWQLTPSGSHALLMSRYGKG
jgi:hypothetical protein